MRYIMLALGEATRAFIGTTLRAAGGEALERMRERR